jgi:uncharacterized RDD family membrane protein YckC
MTFSKPPDRAAVPEVKVNLIGHYAGFISRTVAKVVDLIVIALTTAFLTWLIATTANLLQLSRMLHYLFTTIGAEEAYNLIFGPVGIGVASTLYFALYHMFFWTFGGQTPGMALMGLRVVTINGHKLSQWKALVRILGFILSALPLYLGFLWVLIDDERQAWHDKLVGTYVIYSWEARPDERFLIEETQKLG